MLSARQDAPRLEPGRVIGGKYRLVRRLATGGMGEIWVARNEKTDADVAMKLLHREGEAAGKHEGTTTAGMAAAGVAETLARFRHEAKLGAMLSHRSIVRVFDLLEEADGTLVLVMELLRGESLDKYMKQRGPLSCKEAVAIAVPVLSGLAHAHASGVVHRDVSPANVFLAVDPDGQVTPKLVDFGIAKVSASGIKTLDGRVLGTPRYMSPEQIRGHEVIDGRSDLFSVAVVICELITGVCPFAAHSPAASLAAVLESTVDPDSRIEPRLWLELSRALSKRPYERHKDAAEMAAALCEAVGETESSLAALLRRAPPPREPAFTDPDPPSLRTRNIGGHSVGLTGSHVRVRPAWTSWLVGGALAASLVLVVAAAFHHSPTVVASPAAAPASMDVPLRPPASPESSPDDSQLADGIPLPPPPESSGARSPGAPTVRSTPRRAVPRHPHPKPIATTPGF